MSKRLRQIPLPFPVPPALRVAQLSPGAKFVGVETFVPKRWTDLRAFAPNVIIGTMSEMQPLMQLSDLFVDRALVVLTRFGVKPLNDVARVKLWQVFGVPIFELYLGLDGSLLASECEAHEGWHLAPGVAAVLDEGELLLEGAGNAGLRTGLQATLEHETCPCGLGTPRVLEVEQLRRYLAVTA